MTKFSKRYAPVLTLFVLPALLIEVLYGSTPLDRLYLLVPEMLVYGSAAVIIRTAVRMRGLDWVSVVVLGVGFAVAEECVILQTSLSPFFFGGYGRVFGVNTVYLFAMLGFESVWAILMPIALAEIAFSSRRLELWVGMRGLIVAGVLFVSGSLAAWYSWSHFGIQHFSDGKSYQAPAATVLAAIVIVGLLVAVGLRRNASRPTGIRPGKALRPWLMGLAAFGLALPWFALTVAAFVAPPLTPLVPIGAGIVWAVSVILLVRHWASGRDFGERHRLALIIGALTASWLEGFVIVSSAGALDVVGKLGLDLVAIALLVLLARSVKRRVQPSSLRTTSEATGTPGSSPVTGPTTGACSLR